MESLTLWYKGLQPRERLLVVSAGALLAVTLLFLVFFGPFAKALDKAQTRVERKQADLVWMRGAQNAVRMAAVQSGGATGESLVILVNRTAQQAGIAGALNNQAPQGDDGIRLRLENVSFDALVAWLGMLDQQLDVHVDNANIDRTDKIGIVNASILLKRGARS